MSQRAFFDTNVLVYADAIDEPAKQAIALRELKAAFVARTGVLSTQVLQEYCNVALRKLKLPAAHVRAQLAFYEQFEIVQTTPAILRAGLDLHQTRALSFYDALIVAAAQIAGCATLVSEHINNGVNSGEAIDGVRILNPFATYAQHA